MDTFDLSRQPSSCPDNNEDGKVIKANVTNMARISVIEYHLCPTLPSTFSSMDELESLTGTPEVKRDTKRSFTPLSAGSSDYDEPFQSATGNANIPTIKVIGGSCHGEASSSIHKCISAPNLHMKPMSPLTLTTVSGFMRNESPQSTLLISKPNNFSAKSDESFWRKFSGARQKEKQVKLLESEGRKAIESLRNSTRFDTTPEEFDLAEGEERFHIERQSLEDPKLVDLLRSLEDWINQEMARDGIVMKSLEEDLYDGQILQKLFERLTGEKLEAPEITLSSKAQKKRLALVLDALNKEVGQTGKWNTEMIFSKNLLATLHLLIHLARCFKPELKLPGNVVVELVIVKKANGMLKHSRVKEMLTGYELEEKDLFENLLKGDPQKMQIVSKGLIDFTNKHLKKLNLEVKDLEYEFHDGVYFILLMGILENYFVPIYEYHLSPKDNEQKLFNVGFTFDLMEDAGISVKTRPEDIVNMEAKAVTRLLFKLFSKYKGIDK